ncbi:hypothetical protein KY334_01760, partial [Candidatus Woesearchaeota archaeon]|nr:hypothetical protein [Candidatus Woesearchaeota archaeon]
FTFFKQNAGIQHSFLESSKFIINFIISPLPEILKINTIIILSFFLTMTIFGFNKKNKFLNFTILFVYFGIFLSIYGAIKVVGDLLPYIFNYIHMIILIFYFIIVISALSFFRKNISKIISFTLIILCIIYILHFPHYGNPIKASFKESPHKFIEFIQPSYNYTYRFNSPKGTVHHDRWPIKATIIYELKKDNYNLCVPNEWLFMFGQEFSCENKENIVNIILYTSNKINQSKLNNSFTNKGTTIEIKK